MLNNRQLLIICLLRQLHTVHPNGMRAADLAIGAREMGHPNESEQSVSSLLADMETMGLVTKKPHRFDATVLLYSRTEEARVELARGGHI